VLAKIKADLEKMFSLHGIPVTYLRKVVTERNSLGEALKSESIPQEESAVLSNQRQTFIESLAGDIRSGGVSLVLKQDTQLQENDLIEIENKRYSLGPIEEVRAFKEIICYKVEAERADNHGRSL
jgi:hypothetical protein